MQDTIAPVQTTASNVHRERIPSDLMLLPAKPVPHFSSEAMLRASVVRQRDLVHLARQDTISAQTTGASNVQIPVDLTEDQDLTLGLTTAVQEVQEAQVAHAIPAEQQQPVRQTVREDMAGAVPVALPLLHNVKYVIKEVLWEDTATVPAGLNPTEEAAVSPIVLTLILSAVQTEEEPAVEVPAHVIPIQHQIAGPINVSKVNKAGNSRLVFFILRTAALLSGRYETNQVPAGKFEN